MANQESGNVINANNFVEKINVVDRRKAVYNPTNLAIQLTALTPAGKAVKDAVDAVSAAHTVYVAAFTNRKNAYVKMESLATRAISLLSSSEATKDEIKLGKSLLSKFRSERATDLPDEEVLKAKAAAKGEEAVIPKVISTSHEGFVNKLRHFKDIIIFLKTVSAYKPNETDLTVEALETFAASAEVMNTVRSNTQNDWLKAIADRNKKLYQEPDGAYFLSTKIMDYVAGAFGKKSEFYKELQKYPVRNA